MTVIMPTVVGYKIMTPDMKTVISEHESSELAKLRNSIEGTDNIIHYIFKELDEEK